jgi:iron-only hydrogenase group A
MPTSPEIEDVFKYFYTKSGTKIRKAEVTNAVQFDPTECIDCGRCVRVCAEGQTIGALDDATQLLTENECIGCGQCTAVCPTNALEERNSIPRIIKALSENKVLVLQTAPAVRVAIGEEFGDPVGTIVTPKIITAARKMGFKYVFDTNFAADLTIVEEGSELIHRLTTSGVTPMFTSCCPAWVNFVEKSHPELIPNLSTAKSPHMMLGAVIKSYFADVVKVPKENIYAVSLMPCTAKKDEVERQNMIEDVDSVLTSREFAKMIKCFGIDWNTLEDGTFDKLFGESTGAAALFGVTGGVMEAALRYAHEELTKTKLGKVEYTKWRGFDGIKTASANIGSAELKIAVCNGIASAREFIESGQYKSYSFIEVMACPMGCIAGGGQPKLKKRSLAKKRAEAIYEIDRQTTKATCNDNTEIKELYTKFLGKPNGDLAHKLLHTSYQQQVSALLEMKKKMEDAPIVAFGSASGNSQKLARILAGYLESVPISLNNLSIAKMIKKGTVVIVCSTFGDGEFPSNAQKFYDALCETTEDLSGVKFAMCALGSKAYPKYVYCGHELERVLISKGAKRIMPMVDIDAALPDKGDGAFEMWAPKVVSSLGVKMPEIIVRPSFTFTHSTNQSDSVHEVPLPPVGYNYGVVLSATVLSPTGYDPAMHRYTIKLPVGMTYEAGDHVAILPENNPEASNAVMKVLNLNPDEILDVSTTIPEGMTFVPAKLTVRQLFAQYLDLNGIPTRNLIRAFKQFTTDADAQKRLGDFLDFTNTRPYDDLISNITNGEFIIEYAKYGIPPLDILATAIPHIQPRLYSIASAPSHAAKAIDLVITDLSFGSGSNVRQGLCTSFLRRFGLTRVAIYCTKGCFGYPDDNAAPVLMAALGCGVAPMMSLLQHRESISGPKGPAALFFGCRHKNKYPILDAILQDYIDLGAMQHLYVAYSREGANKMYITNIMENNPDIVWEYWKNPKCEFFYCGPAKGIPDDLRNIIINVTMVKGNMTKEQAVDFYNLHKIHIEAF